VRARRQTRPEAVHLTVQSAFTLWGLPDCSERAEALAMLAAGWRKSATWNLPRSEGLGTPRHTFEFGAGRQQRDGVRHMVTPRSLN